MPVQILCPFKKKGCFFIVKLWEFLCMLNRSSLSNTWFANIFSLSGGIFTFCWYRQAPIYNGSTLWFFDFFIVWNWYTFSWNCTSSFEFWSLPGLVICGTICSCNAGQGSEPQLPVSHAIRRVNNQYAYILFFTFSRVFSKLHETFNTLLKNRLWVRWFCPTVG